MRSSTLAAALLLTLSASAAAAEMITPDPALSPQQVIKTQLSALQQNDIPEIDAGIAQAWAFAHPENKRMTGPLPRFARMVKGPAYEMLLDHQAHEIEEVSQAADEAVFAVTVTSQTGAVIVYEWRLRTVAQGDNAGAWMTTAVSPPIRAGQSI